MKKILLYIGVALAVIGCTKDETITHTDGEINLSAAVVTRVASDDDCAWAEDDQVGIFTDQGESNLLFTISDTATGALENKSDTHLYTLPSGERTYYAYHPYSAAQNETTTIDIDCTTDQSQPLLWATATSNNADVTLRFAHKYAKVTFSLMAGSIDVTSLNDATVTLTGAYSQGKFNVEAGEFYDLSTPDITLTIDKTTKTITAYLPPMDAVAGNVKLWITAQNNTYLKTFTDEEWQSGSSYAYDITVGKVAITNDGDDYFVYTATGLFEFADLVNAGNLSFNCTLMGDIDLGGEEWTPIGDSDNPYSGTFDGGGCTINGLHINTNSSRVGLFGSVEDGSISNLTINEPEVTGGSRYTGAVCGSAKSTTIESCGVVGGSVSGPSSDEDGTIRVGGVVGYVYSSSITECYNMGSAVSGTSYVSWNSADVGGVVGAAGSSSTVTSCYNTGDVSGTSSSYIANVGGVVGYATGSVTSCYNMGSVSGAAIASSSDSKAYVGGVVGSTFSSVTLCYNTGELSVNATNGYVGGVVGKDYNNNNVTSCYYDSETSKVDIGVGLSSSDATTGLTTEQMKGDASTDGTLLYYLTSSDAWVADTEPYINDGYPILTWQIVND